MSLDMKVVGVQQCLRNLRELPKRVKGKHLKIGLSKGGGILRDAAKAYAPKETGTLRGALVVKTPSASKMAGGNAYALVGASRRSAGFFRTTSRGKLVRHGASAKEFKATLGEGAKRRDSARFVQDKFNTRYRNAARYSHIVEKGRRKGRRGGAKGPNPFHARAVQSHGATAQQAAILKIHTGLIAEARALSTGAKLVR